MFGPSSFRGFVPPSLYPFFPHSSFPLSPRRPRPPPSPPRFLCGVATLGRSGGRLTGPPEQGRGLRKTGRNPEALGRTGLAKATPVATGAPGAAAAKRHRFVGTGTSGPRRKGNPGPALSPGATMSGHATRVGEPGVGRPRRGWATQGGAVAASLLGAGADGRAWGEGAGQEGASWSFTRGAGGRARGGGTDGGGAPDDRTGTGPTATRTRTRPRVHSPRYGPTNYRRGPQPGYTAKVPRAPLASHYPTAASLGRNRIRPGSPPSPGPDPKT